MKMYVSFLTQCTMFFYRKQKTVKDGQERILGRSLSEGKFSAYMGIIHTRNKNPFQCQRLVPVKPGFHDTANITTTTQKQSSYKVEQSSFTLIALFGYKISLCHGCNWLDGNQA